MWIVSGLVCLGLALLVARVWWGRAAPPPPSDVTREAPSAAGEPSTAAPVGAVPPPPPVSAPPPAIPADRETLPPEIQRYLAAHEYPPHSGVLTPGSLDLLHPNRRFEREKPVPGSGGAGPPDTFLWTADRLYYTGGETVQLRFAAYRGGEPAPLDSLEALAWPEGGSGPLGSPIPVALDPAGDGHAGSLPLLGAFGDHHGPVALLARYQLAGGRPEEELIRVFVTPEARIPARFTGSYRDRAEDGSLVVEVGVEVLEAGFYRIDANLRDAAGEPVAFGHWKGVLDERAGFVPVSFFGKVLRDAGVPGPYRVTELRGYRFLDGSFPDRERMRDATTPFATRAWTLADFSDAPYESEHLARMVELLQQDLDAGIGIDLPPVASEGPPGVAPAGEQDAAPDGAAADDTSEGALR